MALKIPSTLRLAQLKTLAFKCGVSSSSTKPILSQRLHDEITKSTHHASKPTRILSIDMGIRNLAYCILDVSPTSLCSPNKASQPTIPIIQSWHRLAVSTAPKKSQRASTLLTSATKEAFDPSTLSTAAYTLLRHRLLLQNPTHILIERQRFRSMGSKHILEWTIRVNMFESILYAVLFTLKEEGLWGGKVVSVMPGKVGPFWVGEDDAIQGGSGEVGGGGRKVRNSKSAKIRNKGLKVDLVRRWLESGDVVGLGNKEVEDMARAYREKWDAKPGGKVGPRVVRKEGEEQMGKLDDLADCLLQGMAWIQWEDNKRIALKNGVEALLEP